MLFSVPIPFYKEKNDVRCYKAEYQVFQEFCTLLFLHYKLMSCAQTMSQGNRGTHVQESYRSTDVWQSPIITSMWYD